MVTRLKTDIPVSVRGLVAGYGVETISRLVEGVAASPVPLALFDPEDRLVYCSSGFATLYAVADGAQTFSSVIRHCYGTGQGPLIRTDDIELWLKAADRRRRSVPYRRFEIDFRDGRWFQAHETSYGDGWVLLVLVDLTAFKAKETDLTIARDAAQEEARTDDLTGIASRRAIMRYLDTAARAANPLTIALIDLDHFKQINDTLGHDAGDEVLRHLGRELAGAFRNTDRAGRVGGEEFLLVMPGTHIEAGWRAVQRFRRDWLRASRPLPLPRPMTFSVGIAERSPGQSAPDLYRAADRALYRAKSAGRDRMVCANGAMPDLSDPMTDETVHSTGA